MKRKTKRKRPGKWEASTGLSLARNKPGSCSGWQGRGQGLVTRRGCLNHGGMGSDPNLCLLSMAPGGRHPIGMK